MGGSGAEVTEPPTVQHWVARLTANWTWFGAVLLAAVAVVLYLYATTRGIGLDNDSVSYVEGAKVLRSDPFRFFSLPSAHFPPLYSVALAFAGGFAERAAGNARALHLVLLTANCALYFLLIKRRATGTVALVSLALLVLSRGVVVSIHGTLLSEALFTTFLLGVLVAADTAIGRTGDSGYWWGLGVAGVLAGGASLTRLVGLSLVPFLALAILAFAPIGRRLRSLLLVIPLAAAPAAIWFLTHSAGGDVGDRALAYHPPSLSKLRLAPGNWAEWLLPERLRVGGSAGDLVVAVAALAGLIWLVSFAARGRREQTPPRRLMVLLALTTLCYIAGVLLSLTFLDAQIPLDRRLLFPAYMCMVGFVSLAVHSWIVAGRLQKVSVRVVACVALGGLLVVNAQQTVAEARVAYDEGIGSASRVITESPLFEYARQLPPEASLYTNSGGSYWVLNRDCCGIPRKYSPNSLAVNEQYEEQLLRMGDDVEATGGAVLYFDALARDYLPTPEEIEQKTDLRIQQRAPDGVILTAGS